MRKIFITGILTFFFLGCFLPSVQAASNGWKNINGDWYYYTSSNTIQKGWKVIRNNWYFFDQKGIMQTGWVKSNSKWYFLQANGSMRTGWLKENGIWYFLDKSSGAMKTGWMDTLFYFNKSGAMQTGWVKVDSKWYYMNKDGIKQNDGWINDGSDYYFLAHDGAMKTGWIYNYAGPSSLPEARQGYMYAYSNGKLAHNTMIEERYLIDAEGIWIPSKNLEKYYKPLHQAAVTNGALVNIDCGYHGMEGSVGEELNITINKDGKNTIWYYQTIPDNGHDFNLNYFSSIADSKYTKLLVDTATALGCPLDKDSLTNLINEAINNKESTTQDTVIVSTNPEYSTLFIEW